MADPNNSPDATKNVRLYIPAVYVDEIYPKGRASPNAWIGAPAGDVWLLATEEEFDFVLTLKPGKTVVFNWIEHVGTVRVEIRDDGTCTILDPVPEGVNHFAFGRDFVTDTLDEFVEVYYESFFHLEEDQPLIVDMARWSPEAERFRFEVVEGGPRFVPSGTEVRS